MGSSAKGALAGAAYLRLLPAAHDQPVKQLFEVVAAATVAVATIVGTMTKTSCQTDFRHPDESTVICAEQPYIHYNKVTHSHTTSHGTLSSLHIAQHALKQVACRVVDVLG